MNVSDIRSPRLSHIATPSPWESQEQENTDTYADDVRFAATEPGALHGEVCLENPDGTTQVLKTSGQTSPTAGANGPDIPASAVRNNRVFIYVDGIRTTIGNEQEDIQKLFESPGGDPSLTHVDQPTIGIQEGVSSNFLSDAIRITKDFQGLKALQGGTASADDTTALYANDPAIKSVHDEVRQSLEAGRDVLLAAHSGGGAETAVALTLLSKEDGGHFASAIRDHVRVLEVAPAASIEDFQMAGVKPENIYYTASQKDAVYGAFHTFVPPGDTDQIYTNALDGLLNLIKPGALERHSPYYSFSHNVTDGQSTIQQFLDGTPNGGDHSFPD